MADVEGQMADRSGMADGRAGRMAGWVWNPKNAVIIIPGPRKRESIPPPHWSSVPAPPVPPIRHPPSAIALEAPYRVQLDAYAGPLDLLLHLVKQHEIDLHDIPIATLTTQYLAHLDQMARVERTLPHRRRRRPPHPRRRPGRRVSGHGRHAGGDQKCDCLMPRIDADEADAAEADAEAGDAADPRFELVRQLLAYKKFKDAALLLEETPAVVGRAFCRRGPHPQARGHQPRR